MLFLLYVAITALTRYLAVDSKELDVTTIVAVTASILLLTLAVLVLQIAASRFTPSNGHAAPHDMTVDAVEKTASGRAPTRNT